ncbi:Ras guanine nucleotide exchange factor bud5 [Savitreella phatthalungensis]
MIALHHQRLNTVGSNAQQMPPSPGSSRVSSLSSAVSTLIIGDYQDFYRAIHPFEAPTEASNPRTKCLTLQPGMLLYIHHVHETGWADGSTLDGERGWFPSNFCEPILPALLRSLGSARDTLLDQLSSEDTTRLGVAVQSVVAEVRQLLETTGCLSRTGDLVQADDNVRRQRKLLLHELAALTRSLKRVTPTNTLDLSWHTRKVYKAAARLLFSTAMAGRTSISPNDYLRSPADLLTPVSMDFPRFGGSVSFGTARSSAATTISTAGDLNKPLPPVDTQTAPSSSKSAVDAVNQLRETLLSSLSRLTSESQLTLKLARPGALGSTLRGCADSMRSFLSLVEAINGRWRDRRLARQVQQLYRLVTELVSSTKLMVTSSHDDFQNKLRLGEDPLAPQTTALVRAVNECIARLQDLFSVHGDFPLMQAVTAEIEHEQTAPAITITRDATASSLASSNGTNPVDELETQVSSLSVAHARTKPETAYPILPDTPATPDLNFDQSASVVSSSPPPEVEQIVYSSDGRLIGASLAALVQRLTPHDHSPETKFVDAFMQTFRLFTTPEQLAVVLEARFANAQDLGELDEEARVGPQRLVRLRAFNLLKKWLEVYWRSDTDEPAKLVITRLANSQVAQELPGHERRLHALLERTTLSSEVTPPQRSPVDSSRWPKTNLQSDVVSRLSSPEESVSVLDLDACELARQITLLEAGVFLAIKPEELLGQEFEKPAKDSRSINIKRMGAMSTDLAAWVADSILNETNQNCRSRALAKWVAVARYCLELQNYNTLFAVLCALASSTISRLKRTWNGVSESVRQEFASLKVHTEHDRNYSAYRARLRLAVAPCLPFVGLFLTDLTFITQGNPDARTIPARSSTGEHAMLPVLGGFGRPVAAPTKVINFDKYARISAVLSDVQRLQVPYDLRPVPEMQNWLEKQLHSTKQSANDLYRRSLVLEPRAGTTAAGDPSATAMARNASQCSEASSALVGVA